MIIKLTQDKETSVGPRDYKYLTQWSWRYMKNPKDNTGYAVRGTRINGKYELILMHRVILERMGYKEFQKSDHIDRNGLNNLRGNLRPATHRQSSWNLGKFSNASSKYIGVSWHKQNKKWHVQIWINGKNKYLGLFDSEIEAARVRDQVAKKYRGKFAVLNKV